MPRVVQGAETGLSGGAISQPYWLVMFLSWLVPGYGYFAHGRRGRAVLFFGLLQSTFLIGAIAFKGCVIFPDLNPRSEGFNLVVLLGFFVQMMNGGLGLISMLPSIAGRHVAILPFQETSAWFDLGSFYLLVSGGMNYFVMASLHDRFYAEQPAEGAAPGPAGEGVK